MVAVTSQYNVDNCSAETSSAKRFRAKRSLYDGDNVAADYVGGSVDKQYVTPWLDENLALITGGSTYWYSTDGLGSVRTLTDGNGDVVNEYAYTAWGESYSKTESVSQRYQWTAREKSATSGLQYNRYRWYFDGVGRWGSRDSLESPEWNLYTYASNVPVYSSDAFGLSSALFYIGDEGFEDWSQPCEHKTPQGRACAHYAWHNEFGLYAATANIPTGRFTIPLISLRIEFGVWLQEITMRYRCTECTTFAIKRDTISTWEWWNLDNPEGGRGQDPDWNAWRLGVSGLGNEFELRKYGVDVHDGELQGCYCNCLWKVDVSSYIGFTIGAENSFGGVLLSPPGRRPPGFNPNEVPQGTGFTQYGPHRWGYQVRCQNARCVREAEYGIGVSDMIIGGLINFMPPRMHPW